MNDSDNPGRFELLSAYLDDELAPAERSEVEALLARDAEAAACLDQLREVQASMRGWPSETAPPGFADEVMAAAERQILLGEVEEPPLRRLHWGAWSAAAAIVVMIGLAGTVMLTDRAPQAGARRVAGRPSQPETRDIVALADKHEGAGTEVADRDETRGSPGAEVQLAKAETKDGIAPVPFGVAGDRDEASESVVGRNASRSMAGAALEESPKPVADDAKAGRKAAIVEKEAPSPIDAVATVSPKAMAPPPSELGILVPAKGQAGEGGAVAGDVAAGPVPTTARTPVELTLSFRSRAQADRFVQRWVENELPGATVELNTFSWRASTARAAQRQYIVLTTPEAISGLLDDYAEQVDLVGGPTDVQMKIGPQQVSGWDVSRNLIDSPDVLEQIAARGASAQPADVWQDYFERITEGQVATAALAPEGPSTVNEDAKADLEQPRANSPARLDDVSVDPVLKERLTRSKAQRPERVTLMLTIREVPATKIEAGPSRPAPRITPRRPERRPTPSSGQRRG